MAAVANPIAIHCMRRILGETERTVMLCSR